jgi:hypothetical protein
MQKREGGASLAIGLLVALKPTTMFWPLFLSASGERRMALKSLTVTAAVSLLPVLVYGPSIYIGWLNAVRNDKHWIEATDIALPAYFARSGVPRAGLALALAIALALVLSIRRFRPSIINTTGIALCAAILCSPLGWAAYATMLAPAFVARRWDTPLANVAAVLLGIPALTFAIIFRDSPGSMMLAAGLTYSLGVWLMLAYFFTSSLHANPLRPKEVRAPARISV